MRVNQIANNQFEIYTSDGVYLQSYSSIVAFKPDDNKEPIQLGEDWDYSRTTMKYVNWFLGQDAKETRRQLKAGECVVNKELYCSDDKSKEFKKKTREKLSSIISEEPLSLDELVSELNELMKEWEN